MSTFALGMFGIFIAVLMGLLFLHHHKKLVVYIGFSLMTGLFVFHTDFSLWLDHFSDPHRLHLLIDLSLLLPAFALVAHYFEHSGASEKLAKTLKSDTALLWSVFVLSIFLDNIAAALIGATIVLAKYGKDAPFRMLVGCICASNLGGAGSPVGDTTTVMMYISKDPIVPVTDIFKAFVATIPAQILLCLWASRHGVQAQISSGHSHNEGKVQWAQVLPMLAIPGLIIGNLKGMPGVGVWAGLLAGLVLARLRFDWKIFKGSLANTLFLVTLVGAAEMLPLDEAKPYLEKISRTSVAVLMGFLSPWFDNIPLTAICLRLKDFDWGLLAYCVGFGGSAMWFGSSAGVAVGLIFNQVYDTKRWLVPFFAVTGIYLSGVACYLAIFKLLLN